MSDSNPVHALVLSGGGGRGAYHVGVLRFLEEHEWVPDVIVGTSIGAVNGAAIASGHTAHSLWALWRRLRTDDVQRRGWDLFSLDEWDHVFDTAPLRRTLVEEGWIDLARINARPPARPLRITGQPLRARGPHAGSHPGQLQHPPGLRADEDRRRAFLGRRHGGEHAAGPGG